MKSAVFRWFDLTTIAKQASDEQLEAARMFNHSWTKHALDYFLTIPGIIILSPFLLFIALMIKIDSKGPVFFKQKRVGINGRIFEVYKFRTMFYNVDESLHKKQIEAFTAGKLDPQKGIKLTNDPRVTRAGRFLRATSLDEIPQVINVLKGEMSLVGPRPVPIYEAEKYKLWQSERVGTLPGMTGLWQVLGRSQVSFDEMLRLDIRYIRTQSLWLNIKILLMTFPAILSKRGAG